MSEAATVTTVTPQREVHAAVHIEIHNTPEAIIAALALVFGEKAGTGTHRWVTLKQDATTINFHAGTAA